MTKQIRDQASGQRRPERSHSKPFDLSSKKFSSISNRAPIFSEGLQGGRL